MNAVSDVAHHPDAVGPRDPTGAQSDEETPVQAASLQRSSRPNERDESERGTHELHGLYMRGWNMMCALGVPGNISHGVPAAGCVDRPVDAAVAPGM